MNSLILRLWGLWDPIYYHFSRLQYVDQRNNLFRIALIPYWDSTPLYTRMGEVINKGDLVIKIHIHNYRLAQMIHQRNDSHALGLLLLREIRRSLPGLAHFILTSPFREKIKGLVGTTFLYRGSENLGFTVTAPPLTLKMRIKNIYLRWMLTMIHPDGRGRTAHDPSAFMVKRVFMSAEELVRRYVSAYENHAM